MIPLIRGIRPGMDPWPTSVHSSLFAFTFAIGSLLLLPNGNGQSAFAQVPIQDSPAALTLAQVVEAARNHYPAIQAAQAQQRAAEGAIRVAKTAYLPRTDVLWQTNRATANNILGLLLPQATIPSVTGTILPSDPTRSAWNSAGGALLSWQPLDFGARGAQVEAARQGSEAARQATSLTQLEGGRKAGSAFLDLAA